MIKRCKRIPSAFLSLPTLAITALITVTLFMESTPAQASKAGGRPAPAVTAAIVENTLVNRNIPALGTLKANQSVEIVSRVSGRVSRLHIEDGISVNKGDTLINLDSREQKARVQEAEVALAEALRKLENSVSLLKRKAISQDQLDAQQAIVDKAKAVLSREKTALSYHTLKAPFSGILGFSEVSTGALLSVNQTITTLDDLSVMKLYFELPENSLSRVAPGTKITATTDAWPNHTFTGTIDTINPRINTNNLTFTARAVLDNENSQLRPGMMVRISVEQKAMPTLSVPARSVMFDGSRKYVYRLDNKNIAHKKYIQTGESLEETISVTDGLQAGDRVIDLGVVKARDGSPVKIVDPSVAEGTADNTMKKGRETHS